VNCLECGYDMSVRRTMRGGTDRSQITIREHVCKCGHRYISEQRITRRLTAISTIPVSQGPHTPVTPTGQGTAENSRFSDVPCDSSTLRGEGGCLSPIRSDSVSDSIRTLVVSDPDLSLDHFQGVDPARAKRMPYPAAFTVFWDNIGSTRDKGLKSDALKAWNKHGRPAADLLIAKWSEYLQSLGDTYPKNVSTWLNARGWEETYGSPKAVTKVEKKFEETRAMWQAGQEWAKEGAK